MPKRSNPRRQARQRAEERRGERRAWLEATQAYDAMGRAAPDRTIANLLHGKLIGFVERKLGPEAKNVTAVEVGAGNAPLANQFGFKRVVFVDSSPALLKQLQASMGRAGPGMEFVQADVRNLDVRVDGNNLLILDEVFTHLRPQERGPALERLAARFNRLLLIDHSHDYRFGLTEHYPTGAKRVVPLPIYLPELVRARTKQTERGLARIVPGATVSSKASPMLVSMESLAQKLARRGFQVDAAVIRVREKHRPMQGAGYFALWAAKAKPGERPRIRVKKRFELAVEEA